MAKRSKAKLPETLSEELSAGVMYHGGVVSISGPFRGDAAERVRAEAQADAFADAIKNGMEALRNGTSPYVADQEPAPNARVEVFDIFDVATGQSHMIWRVATRERRKHAN